MLVSDDQLGAIPMADRYCENSNFLQVVLPEVGVCKKKVLISNVLFITRKYFSVKSCGRN